MDLNTLSFFINDEPLVQLNPNVLESNVQNIVILLGILIYANNVSFSSKFRKSAKRNYSNN